MQKWLLIGFILLGMTSIAVPKIKPSERHVTAVAQPGDGIYALLARYHLPQNRYYVDQFRALNASNLAGNDHLVAGRTYEIPIKIYTYNGISIRSTVGISDRSHAERIQAYNRTMLNAGFQDQDYLISKVLWVPFHELESNPAAYETRRKTSGRSRPFSIFGPRYAEVTFTDSDLRGSVFYIVAGHGGPDPGATGKRGNHTLCEDEYAYDIALRLTRNLLAHGAIAYVITRDPNDGIRDEAYLKCDTDEYCWKAQAIPRGQLSRLHQRAEAINRLYWRHKGAKQRVVVLHVDSRSRGNRVDMFFYYHSTSHSGKRLAETLHQTIRRKYQIHQPARGYHGFVRARDELYMLRKPLPTTVYVELGNIKNSFDQLRLIKVDNRQAVANWLTEGLIKDINATK